MQSTAIIDNGAVQCYQAEKIITFHIDQVSIFETPRILLCKDFQHDVSQLHNDAIIHLEYAARV